LKSADSDKNREGSADSSGIGEMVVYTVFIRPEEHMIYGADAISKIIKRDPNEIPALVRECGLSAWQVGPKGKWRALCSDLLEFNRLEKERNFNHCQ
jgi:hypothetical protein